ncbi:hypothetical protein JZ751_014686, partial [Albula glossodonta]
MIGAGDGSRTETLLSIKMRAHLSPLIPGTNAEFVGLCLGHVCALFSIVQLMLELPVLGQVGVCLFLL